MRAILCFKIEFTLVLQEVIGTLQKVSVIIWECVEPIPDHKWAAWEWGVCIGGLISPLLRPRNRFHCVNATLGARTTIIPLKDCHLIFNKALCPNWLVTLPKPKPAFQHKGKVRLQSLMMHV